MLQRDPWIVVSGAGGAIGSALAVHYENKGRRVLGLDLGFDHAGPATPERLIRREVNLLSEQEVRLALDEIVVEGETISILVNAVGKIWNEPVLSFRGAKLATHGTDTWRSVMDANLTAPFIVATQVAARMARARWGSIVNFSSIAGDGNAGQAAYGAAKAGIEGLTRTMGIELGPLGIRVNAVSLGFFDFVTTRSALSEDQLRDYEQRTPIGRLGRLEDVISAIEFLESNEFVNGTILKIDGGLRL